MRLPFMISCQKATELTEKKLSGGLDFPGRITLLVHRQMCNACRRYGRQVTYIDELLRKRKAYPEQPEKLKADSHKLKERIKDKLDHK
jgi:predicted anti-sigma-YlaC factor YlaD